MEKNQEHKVSNLNIHGNRDKKHKHKKKKHHTSEPQEDQTLCSSSSLMHSKDVLGSVRRAKKKKSHKASEDKPETESHVAVVAITNIHELNNTEHLQNKVDREEHDDNSIRVVESIDVSTKKKKKKKKTKKGHKELEDAPQNSQLKQRKRKHADKDEIAADNMETSEHTTDMCSRGKKQKLHNSGSDDKIVLVPPIPSGGVIVETLTFDSLSRKHKKKKKKKEKIKNAEEIKLDHFTEQVKNIGHTKVKKKHKESKKESVDALILNTVPVSKNLVDEIRNRNHIKMKRHLLDSHEVKMIDPDNTIIGGCDLHDHLSTPAVMNITSGVMNTPLFQSTPFPQCETIENTKQTGAVGHNPVPKITDKSEAHYKSGSSKTKQIKHSRKNSVSKFPSIDTSESSDEEESTVNIGDLSRETITASSIQEDIEPSNSGVSPEVVGCGPSGISESGNEEPVIANVDLNELTTDQVCAMLHSANVVDPKKNIALRNQFTGTKIVKTGKWNPEEDALLKSNWKNYFEMYPHPQPENFVRPEYVEVLSERNSITKLIKENLFWMHIGKGIPRTTYGIYLRCLHVFLEHRFNKGEWSEEEEQELFRLYNIHGTQWRKISHILERPMKACRSKFLIRFREENTVKGEAWLKEEDDKLMSALTEMYGRVIPTAYRGIKWAKVTECVGTRNADQCRRRWMKFLGLSSSATGCRKYVVKAEHKVQVIKSLLKQGVKYQEDVNWERVFSDFGRKLFPLHLQAVWFSLKRSNVPDYKNKNAQECLKCLEKLLPELEKQAAREDVNDSVTINQEMVDESDL